MSIRTCGGILNLLKLMMDSVRPGSRRNEDAPRSQSQYNRPQPLEEAPQRFEVKKRTLQNSVLDQDKVKASETARTGAGYGYNQNPEGNDYESQLRQNKQSIYIKPNQSFMNKNKSDKYGPMRAYQNESNQGSQAKAQAGECVLQNTEKDTLKKMVAMSLKHHDPLMCVCAFCTCGRHLCKVHPWKPPGVKPMSIYDKDYSKKKPYEDLKFRPGSSYKDKGPGIDPLSTYTKDYPPKQGNLDPKFLPANCLQTGGPFSGTTTYGTGFPGYIGHPEDTPKPVGGEIVHGFPFSGNSTQRKDYTPKHATPNEPIRTQGNLKLGDPWIGNSTYRENFLKPNNTYATGWKSNLSRVPDPKYANQYDTTYRNDFINQGVTICPAATELQTRSNFFRSTNNFKESKRATSLVKGTH